jgi:hypothetical protein
MNFQKPGLNSLLLTFLSLKSNKVTPLCLSVVLVLGVIGFAVPASASTVGCPGAVGGPFDFPSLSAAIAAAGSGPATILVSGTCTEADVITGVQNLSIVGTPGAALVDPGGDPPSFNAVLEIDHSQGIVIQGLSIQVASRSINTAIPVLAIGSSDVRILGCRLEGAGASDGIDIFGSTVRLIGATIIENNNDGQGDGEGVTLFGPSSLLLLLNDVSGNCPLIQGNGDNGIFAGRGGTTVQAPLGRGCATIQNNGTSGIEGNLGAIIDLSVSQANPGGVQVANNSYGLIASNGSHIVVSGPVLIQENSVDGILVRLTSSGALFPSDGTAGPTIQGNGTNPNPPCCSPSAGINVEYNAHLDMQAGQVMNNSAPGVLIHDDSSARFIGPLSVTRNPVGVQLSDLSSAALFLAPSISGNAPFDLVCGPDSGAHGDASALGKSNCPQFKPQLHSGPLPKHGRPIP